MREKRSINGKGRLKEVVYTPQSVLVEIIEKKPTFGLNQSERIACKRLKLGQRASSMEHLGIEVHHLQHKYYFKSVVDAKKMANAILNDERIKTYMV